MTNQDSAPQIHVISLAHLCSTAPQGFLDLGGELIRPRKPLTLAKRNPETRITLGDDAQEFNISSLSQETATGPVLKIEREHTAPLDRFVAFGMVDAGRFKFVNDPADVFRAQPNQRIDSGSRHSSCWA